MLLLFSPLGPLSVSLFILNPEQIVEEADLGDTSTVISCFSANLSQPLNRVASFQLILSGQSTASFGFDFVINTTSIVVPGNFVGEFVTCVNFTIFGDIMFESNETIVYDVQTEVSIDEVLFPGTIRVDILDNDIPGKQNTIHIILQNYRT